MRSDQKRSVVILIILSIILVVSINKQNQFISITDSPDRTNLHEETLKTSKISGSIHINNNWSDAQLAGIVTGSGNYSDPYVIEDLIINITLYNYSDHISYGILIENSNEYFRIENCTIFHYFDWTQDYYQPGPIIWSSYDNCRAIQLSNVSNSLIFNNNISHNYYGIYLEESCNNTISENNLDYNQNGIFLVQSFENHILKNSIKSNYWAMEIDKSYNIHMSNNTIYYEHRGINLLQSDNIKILDNTLSCNRTEGSYQYGQSINIDQSKNTTISGNTINDESGITLDNSFNTSVMLNDISQGGLLLSGSFENISSHSIDSTNLVNKKPIYYYKNEFMLGSDNFTDAGQVILVNCNNSQITRLNISKTLIAISLFYSNNNNLSENIVDYNMQDIFLSESNNNTISGNSGNNLEDGLVMDIGIFLSKSNNNYISGNDAFNNFLENSDGNRIIGNTGGSEIDLIQSNHNLVIGNTIVDRISLYETVNNTFSMNNMSYFELSPYNSLYEVNSHLIDDTNLVNGKPLYYYANRKNLVPNNFTNAGQVILVNCSNSLISGLNISKTFEGLLICYSDYNTITGNFISNNYYNGINVVYSDFNIFSENIVNNNSVAGFHFALSDYNIISSNTVISNDIGIEIRNCILMTISENLVIYNYYNGFYLDYIPYSSIEENIVSYNGGVGFETNSIRVCTFTKNIIENNDGGGIHLHGDTIDNLVWENYISNPRANALDDGVNNQWDNGKIGNYWNDYSGFDLNNDGIGDSPYFIPYGTAGSQDNYPLWDWPLKIRPSNPLLTLFPVALLISAILIGVSLFIIFKNRTKFKKIREDLEFL